MVFSHRTKLILPSRLYSIGTFETFSSYLKISHQFLYHQLQPAVMHLACVNQRMSLNEALAASTINAAHSLGRSATHGSIEIGKVADFVVIDAPK